MFKSLVLLPASTMFKLNDQKHIEFARLLVMMRDSKRSLIAALNTYAIQVTGLLKI